VASVDLPAWVASFQYSVISWRSWPLGVTIAFWILIT